MGALGGFHGALVGLSTQRANTRIDRKSRIRNHGLKCSHALGAKCAFKMYEFPPTPEAAQARLDAVRPMDYAHTRNALNGAVTCLSPYLTHGFLSVPDVARAMFHNHRVGIQHKLIYELGWREYFQHMQQHLGAGIGQSLHEGVLPEEAYSLTLPEDVRHGCTRVPVIDHAIRMLYATGYLHNHARLWLASYIVHLRKVHWRVAADWLYPHLLDGDVASNYLSWQWVAGTGSKKPYLFNAESIEAFAPPAWYSRGTAIDVNYETLEILATNQATVSQAQKNELAWEEPPVLMAPPEALGFVAPQANVVTGREVWLVHPWVLANVPTDAPADAVVVAAMCPEMFAQHPWDERRWLFVGERMAALTPHLWWGAEQDLAHVLSTAKSVHTVAHARFDDLAAHTEVPWQLRPAPKLFRQLEQPYNSFSKWWVQVNKGVRHLQQLIYPLPAR
jgi:deoxyribodipyrimidine photo-lyase